MGSGMPISAVIGKKEVMDAALPGTIGGTYIGSPLSCVAAIATLKYMEDININALGEHVGNVIRSRFNEMKARFPQIGDIRGVGAMMAMEFVHNGDPRQPDGALCSAVVQGCSERGLIIISAGTHKNIIRILSPLTIEDELLHKGLDIIEGVIEEAVGVPERI
jgi:4-aminobutyrate aminotransferase/(S)-3-amino-2-methylpropionate transaminase